MFQTIRLTFDRARKIVTTVEMTEATGDATVIEFQHIQQNKPVSAKAFSLD
jgi:outer membrane lipoprotein-sorting protein